MNKPWMTADKVFQRLSVKQLEALDDEQAESYYADQDKHFEQKEIKIQAQIDELKKGSDESNKAQIKALEALKEDNSALRSILKTQGENIANLIQSNNSSQKNETLADELKKNMSVIEDIAKGLTKKELQISKANTIRTSITDNSESLRLLDIARLAHVKLSMYDVFSKIPVTSSNHNGVITYTDWDEATTVRAADMVAEGGLFPESTATWIEKKLELRKVGDTLPVSEEFYEDEARFASELDLFLQTNVDIKVDDQICNGDGTGQNLKGLIASSFSFSSTGLTTVPDASFYDLLAITPEMNIGYGSKYMFDVVE